ncbi:MAG: zinc-ribbon domain-containing protein, partial [Ruminococcaceae bacterium]|nr:zinc-ribbon domain-containing protein [Oscillospiraceae bacterium]
IVDIDQHLETLSEALRKSIAPGFEEYGLTVPQLYINNILLPEDNPQFQKLREMHTYSFQTKQVEAEQEMKVAKEIAERAAKMEGMTTEIEMERRKAEIELIKAQTEAQKTRLGGFAEAEVMQAKGYNQKDVFQRDVQIAFAEGMGQMGANGGGAGGGGMVSDMVGLGVGMAAAGQMSAQMMNMFKGMPGVDNNNNTAAPAAPAPAPAAPEAPKEETCPGCGKPVPANAKFCLECGTKIVHLAENEMLCPACGQKTPKGKFCMECGAPLIRKCPKCGNEVPDGAKFCLECGEKL